ncbi:MAG TPA: zinc ribbon domain-containing protein [Thermoplasmata archaeon]|nr:zinc ribbon domain-containing protein [Thermoplasmata archaeon]
MATCPTCARPVEDGALFCEGCGHTVPQGPPTLPAAPPAAGPPTISAPAWNWALPPPPDWIPPAMRGIARHCIRCNTLISSVAVVCPVCQSPQPPVGGGVGAGAPPG